MQTVAKARQYFGLHLQESIEMTAVPQALGISQDCLNVSFEQVRGMTPAQALLEQRLNGLFAALTDQPRQGLRRAIKPAVWMAPPVLWRCLSKPLASTCRCSCSPAGGQQMTGCSGWITRSPRLWCCPPEALGWSWPGCRLAPRTTCRQHGPTRDLVVLLNPFLPFSTAKVLALKATLLLLLTLLIKARVQIVTGSAIGIFLLLLQTLVFFAISGGLVLAAGGAALYATQQRRTAVA